MTRNQIEYLAHLETKRANRAKERETIRSNLASEIIKSKEAETNRYAAETQRLNYGENVRSHVANESYNIASLAELNRANLAKEAETQRHNVATENLQMTSLEETIRHNKASENLGYANVNLGYAQLSESTRTHKANEFISQQQADAQVRKVQIDRDLGNRNLTEQERSNRANENLKAQSNSIQREGIYVKAVTDLTGSLIRGFLPIIAGGM